MAATKLAYFGTDLFSARVLSQLLDTLSGVCVTTVGPAEKTIRIKGRAKKRISEMESFSAKRKLKFFPWNSFKYKFNNFRAPCPFEIGVVVSFGCLLPSSLLNWFPKGCINSHPSLLPQWRGPAPIQHAILSGQDTTGVTIQELSHNRFDAGKILLQKSCEISPDADFNSLLSRMADMSATLLAEALQDVDGLRLRAFEQDETQATYAPRIAPSVGNVDRSSTSVDECLRLYRAVGEHIGVWVRLVNKRVRLLQLVECRRSHPHMTSNLDNIHYNHEERTLYLKFSDGWIGVQKLQVETRNPITATDFYNAYMTRLDT